MTYQLLMASESDTGGAGLACKRLHQALNRHSNLIQSDWLVLNKSLAIPSLHQRYTSSICEQAYLQLQNRVAAKASAWASSATSSQATIAWPNTGLPRYVNDRFPRNEIIHFHSIGSSLISLSELGSFKYPIVWTLHDEWPTIGFNHYSNFDRHYRTFEISPQDSLFSKSFHKLHVKLSSKLKRRVRKSVHTYIEHCIQNVSLFIAPSIWLANQVRSNIKSFNPNCIVIPNPIDFSFWYPLNKASARDNLGMHQDAVYILYVGTHLSDPRKGHRLFKEASFIVNHLLQEDASSKSIRLAVIGPGYSISSDEYGLKIDHLGTAKDELTMRMAYSATDIVCIPSLADNLPNVATEAQACGVPVVCFDIGGLPETVVNEKTGIVCNQSCSYELGLSLKRLACDENLLRSMSELSRAEAKLKWDEAHVISKYESALLGLFCTHSFGCA